MAKVSLKQLKEMIREAVREQLDEQIAGGGAAPMPGVKRPRVGGRPKQAGAGGVQGLLQSGMSAQQLAQQAAAAKDPGQRQEYLQAFGVKAAQMNLNDLMAIVKSVDDAEIKKLASSLFLAGFEKIAGVKPKDIPPPPPSIMKFSK